MSANTLARPVARLGLLTAMLLMIPLVGMQLSEEVVWSPYDFILAGSLLFGTGLAYLLISRRSSHLGYRAGAALALGSTLFLIWANLAVGLIGSEDNLANAMYLAVIAVGVIGAALARLRPTGMSRTLYAMAGVQALIGAIAIVLGLGAPASSALELLGINGMFIVLFLASAFLFQGADGAETSRSK